MSTQEKRIALHGVRGANRVPQYIKADVEDNKIVQTISGNTTPSLLAHTFRSRRMPRLRCQINNDDTSVQYVVNGSISQDSDNMFSSTTGYNVKLTKTTTTSSGAEFYESTYYSPPLNIKDTYWVFPFYIHNGSGDSDPANLVTIYVYAYDGSNWGYIGCSGYDYSQCHSTAIVGYRVITGVTSSSSLDLTNIKRIKFIITTKNTTDTPSVTFGALQFYEKMPRGQIYFTVDDCPTLLGSSQYLWDDRFFNYLASKGLVGTAFCIEAYFRNRNTDRLRAWQRMGHLVANHCNDEPWADWTMDEKKSEIRQCAKTLLDEGFARGARICATPGGVWHPSEDWEILGGLLDVIRSTQNAGSPRRVLAPYPNQIWCTDNADDATNSLTTVDEAMEGKAIGVLLFHPPYIKDNWSAVQSVIDKVAEYRDAGLIDVFTMDNLINPYIGYDEGFILNYFGATSDATQTEIFVGGIDGARYRIVEGRAYQFICHIVGNYNSGEEVGGYKVEGIIKNYGGTTSLVGSVTQTVLAEDDASWDVTAEADDTNEALSIKVTGADGKTIHWVATVNLTEVG